MIPPTGGTEGFAGPLVLGSIRGLRKFNINAANELTGLFYRQAWHVGENVAHHHNIMKMYPYAYYGLPYSSPQEPIEEDVNAEVHSGKAFMECKCGFYAFYGYEHAQEIAYLAEVIGVIEGYGEVIIGSKGFRAQKAKIIALAPLKDIAPSRMEHLLVRYEGIPFFDKRERMEAEYPVLAPED